MVMEINLGDIVRLRTKHPCGSWEWQVVRLGADIGMKCTGCQRRVLLERSVFERRVKTILSRDPDRPPRDERKAAIEGQIAELKGQWPAHSVQPWLWQKLEALEEELNRINEERSAEPDAE
ncbi:MAG: DUF951 domain-containing protein [Dehalococcoidales bacterium]